MPQLESRLPRGQRHMPLNDSPPLGDEPKIAEMPGKVRVLCVDGLCIALVRRNTNSLPLAEDALAHAMAETQAPNGTMLVSSGPTDLFTKEAVRKLAERGITVRYARTEDHFLDAQRMIAEYWSRRKLVRRSLRNR